MDFSKMLFGGAAIGLLFSSWEYIKGFFLKFFGLFIQTVNIYDYELAGSVVSYLFENYHKVNLHDKSYYKFYVYLNSYRKYGNVPAEDLRKSDLIFKNGWKLLFYKNLDNSKSSNGIQNGSQGKTPSSNDHPFATLYFFRGTFDIDNLIGEAASCDNERYWNCLENNTEKRFSIIHMPSGAQATESQNNPFWFINPYCKVLKYRRDELGFKNEEKKALDRLVFPEETMGFIDIARKWHSNRTWYESKGIPWKTGWLLHGEPGTGKSALARAIGMELDLPIYSFRLGEMTSAQFVDSWRSMQKSSPCVALFEDFDNVFHGRENVTHLRDVLRPGMNIDPANKKGQSLDTELTFDTFLNSLDGVERYEGVFIIITSNDITKIDNALLSRPGRVDKVIKLTTLTEDNKIAMINMILGDIPRLREEMLTYIKERGGDESYTPARFQEVLVSKALAHFMGDI